jgi:hypothetical protein
VSLGSTNGRGTFLEAWEQWWTDEDPCRGGHAARTKAYDSNMQGLSPQAARVANTERQYREEDAGLWLVGADTLAIYCQAYGI